MFNFKLDGGRIQSLISSRYGSQVALIRAWGDRFETEPSKASVNNWAKGRNLPSLDSLLRLACCLDCDPMLLLRGDIDASISERLLMAVLQSLPRRQFSVERVMEIYGPREDWPNDPALRAITGQSWLRHHFSNPGLEPSAYQTVEITPAENIRPRAFHFAYRSGADRMWRPYGMVWIEEHTIFLNNFFEKGLRQKATTDANPLYVSTHFGPIPCEFRVASLHEFGIALVEKNEEVVRFKA